MKRWRFFGLSGLVVALSVTGCARDTRVALRDVDPTNIYVVTSPRPDAERDQSLETVLMEWLPSLTPITMDRAPDILTPSPERIVMFPHADTLPATLWPALSEYLLAGGKALFIGQAPFSKPHTLVDAEWQSYAEQEAQWRAAAADVSGFSAVQLWRYEQSEPYARGTVRVARTPDPSWPGITVETDRLYEWVRVEAVDLPDPLTQPDTSFIAFYAKGDTQTTRLVLRAETRGADEWAVIVPVTKEWEPYLIRNVDWSPIHQQDSPPFCLSEVVAFSVGLDPSIAPQTAGPHTFGLSDIRFGSGKEYPAPPMVPFIAASDARFMTTAYALESTRLESRYHIRQRPVSAVRGQPALRQTDGRGRWLSLFDAVDRAGELQASVAGCWLRCEREGPAQHWGWIGLSHTRATRHAFRAAVHEVLFHLQQGRFITDVFMERMFYAPGDRFSLRVTITAPGALPVLARVAADLLDDDDQIQRRVVSPPFALEPGHIIEPVDVDLGHLPPVATGAGPYAVRVTLEEVGGTMRAFDRVVRPFRIESSPEPLPLADDYPRVFGGRLTLGRIPLFLLGVDYDPGLKPQPDPAWLQARHFPVDVVKRDLDQLRSAGVNSVSVAYTELSEAPQLRYFIEEARARGMWIQIRWPNLLSQPFDAAEFDRMLNALPVINQPKVVSFDLTPALPVIGLDAAWRDWCIEQYGSLEQSAAEELPASFPDLDARRAWSDNDPRGLVLRRFAADFWSQQLGRVTRHLRQEGYRTLVTWRIRTAHTDLWQDLPTGLPLDPGVGFAHLDFVTIGADTLRGHEPDFGGLAFNAAYARGWMEGRPVAWSDTRLWVGDQPLDADYQHQARALERFYELVFATHSVGGYLSDFVPLNRSPLAIDVGLVDAGRQRRPAFRRIRDIANRLRAYRMIPSQWEGRELHSSMGMNGLRTLWPEWSTVYRDEMAEGVVREIRPAGFREVVSVTDATRLGGGTAGPFARMNAEWGQITLDGNRTDGAAIEMKRGALLRAELINTASAFWREGRDRASGTVWMEVITEGRPAQYIPVPDTPPGQRAFVEWQPTDPGAYQLRAHWLGAGSFGPALTVTVVALE